MKYSVALLAAFIIAGSTAPTAPPAPEHTAKFTQGKFSLPSSFLIGFTLPISLEQLLTGL